MQRGGDAVRCLLHFLKWKQTGISARCLTMEGQNGDRNKDNKESLPSTTKEDAEAKTKTKRANTKRTKKRKNEENVPKSTASMKIQKPPNFFLAVQINSPTIKGGMKAVQDFIVDQEPLLRHVVVDVRTAHLTLGLLCLPDEESVHEARSILDECEKDLLRAVREKLLQVEVTGIGHFNKRVVFAKLAENEDKKLLKEIADLLDAKFTPLRSSNPFKYVPHITLMKLSKLSRKLMKKVQRINTEYFYCIQNIFFGKETARSIQLLSMYKNKQDDGYYHCEREIFLPQPNHVDVVSDDSKPSKGSYADFLASYIVTGGLCELSKKASRTKQRLSSEGLLCNANNAKQKE